MKKELRKRMSTLLAVILAVCMLSGCASVVPTDGGKGTAETSTSKTEESEKTGETSPSGDASTPAGETKEPTVLLSVTYPVEPAETLPSEDILKAVRQFGVLTASELLGGSENMLYSPMSLYFALALAAEGANGETLAQMQALLGAEGMDDYAEQCGILFRSLCRESDDGIMRIANSLWMQYGYEFHQEYLDSVKNNLFASIYEVDFSSAETGKEIGRWIADNTGGMLSYDFTPDPSRILSIINTVWLKGSWVDTFNKEETDDGTFTKADGSTLNVPFMHRYDHSVTVYKGDGFIRAEMNIYRLGRMVFILPDEGKTPEDIGTDAAAWDEILHGGTAVRANVNWYVPKYEGKNTLDLGRYLETKIPAAFSGADFSRMTDGDAYIGGVTQKTRIRWDEEGVEAAAYTEIAVNSTGLITEKPEEIEFRLDRPFIYGIQTYDGLDLFVGTVYDPAATE